MIDKCIVSFLTFDPVKDNLAICPEVDGATEECKSICDEVRQSCISSSLGSVNCLSGATLALAMMKDVSSSTHRKATAPYAIGLASAKMCSLLDCFVMLFLGKYCLGMLTHMASWMSHAMPNHSCWISSVSGSSHSTLHCHKVCIKTLALIVTGVNSPNGSNTLDDSLSTFRFVTKLVVAGISDLDVKCKGQHVSLSVPL